VTGVTELGFPAGAFAGQAGVGIGGRLMGGVAAPLAVEVDARITRIVGRSGLACQASCENPPSDII